MSEFKLRKYQREAILMMDKFRGRVLLADEMGCIDGEAYLKVRFMGNTKHIQLKNLIELKLKSNELETLSLNNKGQLEYNGIKKVLYKGLKKTVKIRTEKGRILRLTPDHEVKVFDGWKEAQLLEFGESIVIQPVNETDTVLSVAYAGLNHVYDLVMEDPNRNFVANGIIVHNCGKTLEVLGWLKSRPKITPSIIICPAIVKYHWQREAKEKFNMRSYVCEGRTPPRLIPKREITIINYDILEGWLDFLKGLKHRCIALDEVHYIKSRKAKRTLLVKQLARKARFRIGISGTPQTNRPAELWSILNLLMPEAYNSFFSFSQKFCKPELKPWGWVHTGAKNLPQLHAELKSRCMIRRLKKDVLKELPPKQRSVVLLELRNRNEYNRASKDFLGWLGEKSIEKMKKASKAVAITKIGYLKRLVIRLKAKAIVEWADNFLEQSDEKLVLMGVHKKAVNYIQNKFPRIGVTIDGSVGGRERQERVDKFQNDKDCRLLIGNIKAAGVGITLTAAASLAFFELGWVPADHTQAEDRIHRFGQLKGVMIYYLLARNTIEENICQVLQSKQNVNVQTLDGENEDGNTLDLFELLHSMKGA